MKKVQLTVDEAVRLVSPKAIRLNDGGACKNGGGAPARPCPAAKLIVIKIDKKFRSPIEVVHFMSF